MHTGLVLRPYLWVLPLALQRAALVSADRDPNKWRGEQVRNLDRGGRSKT